MQGNLAKQLAKLVKVKYVEDISLASRVGKSPCTWVIVHIDVIIAHMSVRTVHMDQKCVRGCQTSAAIQDLLFACRSVLILIGAAGLDCPLLSALPHLWMWRCKACKPL